MSDKMTPSISLVMCTYGRTDCILHLINSLEKQSFSDFELIIVDQNPEGYLDKIVASASEKLNVRHVRSELGISRARNVGIKFCRGGIVAFPDDDCWYPPWFLTKAVALFNQHDCACVTGRAADETGRSINGRFETAPMWVNRKNVWTTQIEWMVFFKASALHAVNGYDEEIGVGCATPWQASEGQDIALRLLEAGLRVYYDPSLYGFHAELNISAPDGAMIRKGRGYARGAGYVLRKHHYGLVSLAYWLARPSARLLMSLMQGNLARSRYYMNVAIGRLEGWLGRTF